MLILLSLVPTPNNIVMQGINQTLDGARPYENPAILSVLEQSFFSGPSSIGVRLASKFKSSRADRPDEKEIPMPMLALVATGVCFLLFLL